MKGQAAIEYLMTYGWAMLVLVIIAGLIYSSGIFSPGYLLSEQCDLGPKIPCSHFVGRDGTNLQVILTITNGFEHQIRITPPVISYNNQIAGVTIAGNREVLDSGESVEVTGIFSNDNTARQSSRTFQVGLTYYSCAAEVNQNPDCGITGITTVTPHPISGKIVARVN